LVAFLRSREWVLERGEWETYPLRYGGVPLPRWMRNSPRAWLVVPLIHQNGLEGFVVLDRPRADFQLNWEDCDLLKTVGRQAASALAQEEAAEALSQANQFEAFSKVAAFVAHDLKNVLGQLEMVSSNAARHKDNPAFVEDAFATVGNAVERLSHLLSQLRGGEAGPAQDVDLAAAVERVLAAQPEGPARAALDGPAPGPVWVRADPNRLEPILGHLVQNAREATGEGGSVRVRLEPTATGAALEVTDDGEGMTEEFIRERLFRPFDTTKGRKGMGIGAYEIREFMKGLGGDVTVDSQPGAGTRFRLAFPGTPDTAAREDVTVKEGSLEYPQATGR
jgi:putative PEP-CTERM system histidine kinase